LEGDLEKVARTLEEQMLSLDEFNLLGRKKELDNVNWKELVRTLIDLKAEYP